MAISPIGNLTYINQNTQASLQNQTNRVDATLLNLQEHTDKLKEIEEVRTPEDAQKIDKDRKNQKNSQEERKQKESENKNEPMDEAPSSKPSTQFLDILI